MPAFTNRGTDANKALAYDTRRFSSGGLSPVALVGVNDFAAILKEYTLKAPSCRSDGATRSYNNFTAPSFMIQKFIYFTSVLTNWTTGNIAATGLVDGYFNGTCTDPAKPATSWTLSRQNASGLKVAIIYNGAASNSIMAFRSINAAGVLSGSFTVYDQILPASNYNDICDSGKLVVMRGPLTAQQMIDFYNAA